MNEADLLTASQAAEALSATSQTIRNWIRSGQLQAVRIGNRFLIPSSEVGRMRGELLAPRGEGPWEFEDAEPTGPLLRAAEPRSDTDRVDGLLGG